MILLSIFYICSAFDKLSVVVEEELGGVGEGLCEEKEEESDCFTLLNVFEACNTHPGEFGSPGRADPQLKISALVKKSYR